MWVGLSLKTRLNLLFGLLLFSGLTLNVARLVVEAGPRVRAEDESGLRLAREFVQFAVLAIDEAPDPNPALSRLVKGLGTFRHIRVSMRNEATPEVPSGALEVGESAVPAWFVRLVHPDETKIELPIVVAGRERGPIVIASNPLDEISEIWDAIVSQLTIGAVLAGVLFAVTALIVDRALGAHRGPLRRTEPADGRRLRGPGPAARLAGSSPPSVPSRTASAPHSAQRSEKPGALPSGS